jgi:hypothetical protein
MVNYITNIKKISIPTKKMIPAGSGQENCKVAPEFY